MDWNIKHVQICGTLSASILKAMEECCTASYMDFFHRPYRSCFVLYHPCKSRRYTSSHGEKPSKAGQGCAAVLVSLTKRGFDRYLTQGDGHKSSKTCISCEIMRIETYRKCKFTHKNCMGLMSQCLNLAALRGLHVEIAKIEDVPTPLVLVEGRMGPHIGVCAFATTSIIQVRHQAFRCLYQFGINHQPYAKMMAQRLIFYTFS